MLIHSSVLFYTDVVTNSSHGVSSRSPNVIKGTKRATGYKVGKLSATIDNLVDHELRTISSFLPPIMVEVFRKMTTSRKKKASKKLLLRLYQTALLLADDWLLLTRFGSLLINVNICPSTTKE